MRSSEAIVPMRRCTDVINYMSRDTVLVGLSTPGLTRSLEFPVPWIYPYLESHKDHAVH